MRISFEDVKNNRVVQTYIKKADESLSALGYTEHSFPHVSRVAFVARDILLTLGYDEREAELAQIAGYLHDIGNVINRVDHAQSGAVMAFRILDHMGADPEDIATIITAITIIRIKYKSRGVIKMAIRNLRYEGDEILSKRAREIEVIDDKIKELAQDMIETMHKWDGVGLAGPQVGVLKRIIVIDLYEEGMQFVLINPVLVKTKGVQEVDEGCLSFPNKFGKVERPKEVVVEALDLDGKKVKLNKEMIIEQNEKLAELAKKYTIPAKVKEIDLDKLEELCKYVKENSLCGLGQCSPNPVLSTLRYYRDEYIAHIKDKKCPAGVCTAMKKIVIEEGITAVGTTFNGCTSVKEIVIPEGVESIDEMAFYGCWKLESLTLPSTLKTIGNNAFDSLGLSEIVIPEGVESIGDYAFLGEIKKATIPNSVTYIGEEAFGSDSELVICGERGSYAEEWAAENGFVFKTSSTSSLDFNSNFLPSFPI